MKRYLNSFLLTSIIYILLIGSFFYFSTNKLLLDNKVEHTQISLNHLIIKKEDKRDIKKFVKKESKTINKKVKRNQKKSTKTNNKVLKKKLAKLKPKRAKKEPLKPKIVKKQKIEKSEELKKILAEKVNEKEQVKKIVDKEISEKVIPSLSKEELFLKKYLLQIKKQIQDNVKYSKRARRLNIQGNVVVQFDLLKDGTIKNIKALSGHRLLKKSTIKAIKSASSYFPKVDEKISIKIPIEYKLI